MAKLTQVVEYKASKSLSGGYQPSVYINGTWCYSICRNTKTYNGALNRAKKMAENAATQFPKEYNNIIIRERGTK